MLTNVRERNKIQTVKDIKAVKRRVRRWNDYRESGWVETDVRRTAEDGLGAALPKYERD